MSISPTLSIVIVTYQSGRHISKCISSIVGNIPKEISYEIIIIDNDSKDDTLEKVARWLTKNIKLIINKSNDGFAKAVNRGIKKSKGKLILLLNPDTVVKKNSIQELISCSNSNNGIVGGKMIGADGSFRGSCFSIPTVMTGIFDFTNIRKLFPNNKWHEEFYLQNKLNNIKNPVEVGVVSGGYMLIPRKVVSKVGYLDENFFMYLEDVDYCVRVKKSGFKIMYCPQSIIEHEGGGSSHNKERAHISAWRKSRSYYFIKNHNLFANILLQPLFLFDNLVVKIIKLIR